LGGKRPSITAKAYFSVANSKGFNTLVAEGPRSSVPLDDNVVRAGINYRFGGPVVARY
jgi:hypothetical protein